MPKKVCEHCGASMTEYKHGLSKGLVTGLIKLYGVGKAINLKHLELTRNQWDNFQKLRYWDLVEKCSDADGKGGVWKMTERGRQFIAGNILVSKFVWTYRGDRVRYEGEEVSIVDVVEGYRYRPDYAAEAKPH